MKFLSVGSNTKELEKQSKGGNKWRWPWLEENDSEGDKWGLWLRKPDIPGYAYCECCRITLKYDGGGKKDIKKHADKPTHKSNKNTVKRNQVLPGSSKASKETESMQDRVANQRVILASFISEHCLPFTLAPELLALAKRLSEDKLALEKATISKASATYINTHGVAEHFKEEIKHKLRGRMLSLNVDEATNNNNDKILNVIAQYYDEESNKIEIVHLGSRKQNVSTSADIMTSLQSVLDCYELGWWQILSVLMDNCATMRGVRAGVETLVREKNPDLLNVSGDTVHMVNNVAKTLMNSVDQSMSAFASDIYYDIEESPKVTEIFAEVQKLMNIATPKHLIRPISSRFLQMIEVTSRLVDCLDALTVYYYGFLTESEKTKYRDMVSHIFRERKVSDEAQAAIILLQMSQENQQKSTTSTERKNRILEHLFSCRNETIVKVNLCRGLLSEFQVFVKMFQEEAPLIHTLHTRLVDFAKQFLGMFVRPEHVPDRVKELVKLDVTDRQIHKSDKELTVGKYAFGDLNKARVNKKAKHWVSRLYSDLRQGYVAASQKLLKTLPLDNKMLRSLGVLQPAMASHEQGSRALKSIARQLPNLFTEEELGQLSVEANKYSVDSEVLTLADQYTTDQRVDTGFWVKVYNLESFSKPRYPMLKKQTSSVLTIFSGPLIESSFNIMDDIVEKDRTKLTVINYEAVAIVKTSLKRKKVKSTTMTVNRRMKKSCIHAYSAYKKYLKQQKLQEEERRAEKLNASIQLLRQEKAKRVSKLIKLKNRLLNKKRKRVHDNSETAGPCSESAGPYKRIKPF